MGEPNTEKVVTTLDLLRWAGEKRLCEMLPRPLGADVSDHSTGCQITIYAKDSDGPRIDVWRESVWYSSIYEFNERGKVRGLQPGCEWARAPLDKLFASLLSAYRAANAASNARRKQEAADHAATASIAINRYASMLSESALAAESTQERTAGPWTVQDVDAYSDAPVIVNGSGTIVAVCAGENTLISEDVANAQYIVKCCNGYEKAIEVLRKLIAVDDPNDVLDRFGLVDSMDNSGKPYQSQHLADILAEARAVLSDLGEDENGSK